MKELSGAAWVNKFQGSASTETLSYPFRTNVEQFLAALRQAGAVVTIAATLRPPERAYLMHWCWKISRGLVKASDVPPMAGVDIEWDHGN
ncbi:peptidoglycan-binding domain-containing protein, partial [Cronobacter sakazakii]|nr:peptidoglycan-binding domain-containing protein [Cronobacter sakazakii]EGT4365775.1 peptidoglycan-binding domain-containing protein [Cronobacter sakazakii]